MYEKIPGLDESLSADECITLPWLLIATLTGLALFAGLVASYNNAIHKSLQNITLCFPVTLLYVRGHFCTGFKQFKYMQKVFEYRK